jgi:glycerol-3-phosphate dehydrogenase (NAD(P)+)
MSLKQKQICVLGSGIWGTAIAAQIDRSLGDCVIFTKTPATFESINEQHINKKVSLSHSIAAEIDFAKLCEYENIIIASPSYALDEVIAVFKQYFLPKQINLIIATKGLDVKKSQLISTSISQVFDNQIMILSGPSFADEVINNQFTAISLASSDISQASKLADLICGPSFAVVPSGDIVGLQLSGCMKNVIAILVGMLKSLNYADNLCSAVISRGILDIQTLAQALCGGVEKLDYGSKLAIFGDTVLSCSSIKSRNMSYGMQLAAGLIVPNNLVEGRLAIGALLRMAQNNNVRLKIVELVESCVNNPTMAKNLIEEKIFQVIKD